MLPGADPAGSEGRENGAPEDRPPEPFTLEGSTPVEGSWGETAVGAPEGAAATPPRRRRPALAAGIAYAWRARRALLLLVLAQLAFGLTIALPLRARVAPVLDVHPHAPALAGEPDAYDRAAGWTDGLDWSLLADLRKKEAPFFEGLSLALVWVAVLAWLFGQAAAGGILATAAEKDLEDGAPPPRPGASPEPWTAATPSTAGAAPGPRGFVARFLAGAGRWFFPMLRTSLVFLVLCEGIVRRVVFEAWGGIAGDLESRAKADTIAWWGQRRRELVYVVAFLVLRAAADLGRAHLVAFGRRSALIAYVRGFATLVRHPLRAGGLAVLVGVPEVALLFVCALFMRSFPGGTWTQMLGAFLVLQAAVLVRWTSRAILLAGNIRLLRG